MGATSRLTHALKARASSGASPGAFGEQGPEPAVLAAAAAIGAAIVLAGAIGAFALVSLVAVHSERLESIWWLAAFGFVTPLTVIATQRLLAASASPAGRRELSAAGPCALLALGASLFLARALRSLPGAGVPVPWSLLLAPLAVLPFAHPAVRRRALGLASAAGDSRTAAAVAVLTAGALGVAAFLPVASHDPVQVVRTVLLLAVALAAAVALRRLPLGPRMRLALGIAIPLALALLAWDVAFHPFTSHQNFYLGPANDIRHGRWMLVDDYSQYGVSVIYFLTALLAPLPFGYGTLVLVLGVLCAVMFATIYAVLMIATRSLAFSALGTLAALTASTIATLGVTTEFPSTGFLRFGVPWLLVCALVVAYRHDRTSRPPLVIAYALVGVAAIWSFETAFYTAVTFGATVIAVAATRSDGRGVRCALHHLAAGAAAVALAMGGLVVVTMLGRGTPPHIGGYLDFLRLYSVSGFGQLPIPDWSLGFLMAGLSAISLAAVWAILAHARSSALARPSTVVPLVSVTTFAAVALTYFLGRSHPNNLTHVAPPFVVMVTLWSALAWRAWQRDRNPIAAAGVALAVVCGALLIAQQAPQWGDKAPDSALLASVRAVTGGVGLPTAIQRLTDLPVIRPRTRVAEALVRRSVPRDAPLFIAVDPNIATETLIRLDRSDVLPIGTPEQDALSPQRAETLLRQAEDVPCGTYVVTQTKRMPVNTGRPLLEAVLVVLRKNHPFVPVAASGRYRVFRLGCGPA